MKEKEINELIAKGFVHIRVIFEMAGNPKEHVEKTLKEYIGAIKEDPGFIFIKEDSAPCEQKEEGIWSMFIEADVLVENLEKLNLMCFNLSPASIEIINPDKFTLTDKNVTDWYNDLISKLHEVSAVVKSYNSENELLKLNINRLIRNCITLSLKDGSKNAENLGLKIGIDKEHLQPFLDAMIREEKIVKINEEYQLHN